MTVLSSADLPRHNRRHPIGQLVGVAIAALLVAATAAAHDLFFRASQYHLKAQSDATIDVLSGTFSTSENAITRDRLNDLSLATPGGRVSLEQDRWSEQEPKSTVGIKTADAGTYVLGAAIKPRMLSLSGQAFNVQRLSRGRGD